jgi:hypothetical protein
VFLRRFLIPPPAPWSLISSQAATAISSPVQFLRLPSYASSSFLAQALALWQVLFECEISTRDFVLQLRYVLRVKLLLLVAWLYLE